MKEQDPPVEFQTPSRSTKKVKGVRVKRKVVPPRGITSQGKKKKKPGKQLTPQEKAERELKTSQALELRMAGTSYKDIAQALSLTHPNQAKRLVDRAIGGVQVDAAKELVMMDLARLDEMQMRATHAMRSNGDLNQIHTILRIMDQRYRLMSINDETLREVRADHGIGKGDRTVINGGVQIVAAAPETESEFIAKLMRSVGVDPNSSDAQKLLAQHSAADSVRSLPMLEGSANESNPEVEAAMKLDEGEIVDAEIVD